MYNIAVVVVAYNRKNELKRLLNSIKNANYNKFNNVEIIISIDKATNNQDVVDVAKCFEWNLGNKKLIIREKNLGLRKHILSCGDLVNEYDAIIMLEDDLFVSPDYYNFAHQALEFYSNSEEIAGISLYSNEWNQTSNRPFTPIDNGSDVYLLQLAQSWGQLWSKNMWNNFKEWYLKNIDTNFNVESVPENIARWPETSWLKYNIKYLIDNNKYFVYPRISLVTNFNAKGEHVKAQSAGYQVNLANTVKRNYKFIKYEDTSIKYDCFYEPVGLAQYLNLNEKDLCVDMYCSRRSYENKKYILTMKKLNLNLVTSYALSMRPHELNILYNIKGKDIYLYESEVDVSFPYKNQRQFRKSQILYDTKNLSIKDILLLLLNKIQQKIK